jgi:hypothetical protein
LKKRVEEAKAALAYGREEVFKERLQQVEDDLISSRERMLQLMDDKHTLEKELFELRISNKKLRNELGSKYREIQDVMAKHGELEEALTKSEEEILKLKEDRPESSVSNTLVARVNELETELLKYKRKCIEVQKASESKDSKLKELLKKISELEEEIQQRPVNPKVKELYAILSSGKLDSRFAEFQDHFEECLDYLDSDRKRITNLYKEEMQRGIYSYEHLKSSDSLLLKVLKLLEGGQPKQAFEQLREYKTELNDRLQSTGSNINNLKRALEALNSEKEEEYTSISKQYLKKRNPEQEEQLKKSQQRIESLERENKEISTKFELLRQALKKAEQREAELKLAMEDLDTKPNERDLINFLQCEAATIEELLEENYEVQEANETQLTYGDLEESFLNVK